MASTGAADRDCRVFFSFLNEARQHQGQEARNRGVESGVIRVCFNMRPYLGIEPGAWAQPGIVVRVAKEARIEHQIRVRR